MFLDDYHKRIYQTAVPEDKAKLYSAAAKLFGKHPNTARKKLNGQLKVSVQEALQARELLSSYAEKLEIPEPAAA